MHRKYRMPASWAVSTQPSILSARSAGGSYDSGGRVPSVHSSLAYVLMPKWQNMPYFRSICACCAGVGVVAGTGAINGPAPVIIATVAPTAVAAITRLNTRAARPPDGKLIDFICDPYSENDRTRAVTRGEISTKDTKGHGGTRSRSMQRLRLLRVTSCPSWISLPNFWLVSGRLRTPCSARFAVTPPAGTAARGGRGTRSGSGSARGGTPSTSAPRCPARTARRSG